MINDAIKSALKITIPSLNSEIAKSVGSMNAATAHRHTNKSPHTTNSRSNSPQNQQQQQHKQHQATNQHYQQYQQQQHMQQQQQQKYQKQNSPPTSNPMQALGAKSANSPPTSITNVVSHLHAAKKEAMLKGTTTTPPSSSVGAALLPPGSSQQPRSFSTPSKQPGTAQRPNALGSRPTGVISELDKSKYTLGKWVDTIITQMNDPSIDEIELDDSIKKSNFNPAAAMAKDKEALSNNNTTGQITPQQQQQQKEAVKTRPEFEYVDEQNNDDDIDEDIVPERDEGIVILSLIN